MHHSQQLIQVFARTPIMGRVKSRLARDVGASKALYVHRRLLLRTISAAEACRLPVQYWSADAAGFCGESWMNRGKFQQRRWQRRGDLGHRMHSALQAGLDTAKAVVLIGSDCPEISPDYLWQAFDALTQHDVVIGPANDGGYVLIGMRRVRMARSRTMFRKISWGSDKVLEQTLAHLKCLGLSWACLPPLSDLDHVDDLSRFAEHLRNGGRVNRSWTLQNCSSRSQESGVLSSQYMAY